MYIQMVPTTIQNACQCFTNIDTQNFKILQMVNTTSNNKLVDSILFLQVIQICITESRDDYSCPPKIFF